MKAFAKALAKPRPLTYCDALVTRNDTPPTHISLDCPARRLHTPKNKIAANIKRAEAQRKEKCNANH
jgi:hypothetical protein